MRTYRENLYENLIGGSFERAVCYPLLSKLLWIFAIFWRHAKIFRSDCSTVRPGLQ